MTLTEASQNFKILTRITGAVIAIIIVVRVLMIVYDLAFTVEDIIEIDPVVNPIYQQIPVVEFEIIPVNLATNFSIALDLIAGALPVEPTVGNVYPILKSPYGFLSSDRAKELGEKFSFISTPISLSTTESLWTGFNETLRVNDQTLHFNYEYNFNADPTIMSNASFLNQNQITSYGESIFTRTLEGIPTQGISTANPSIFLVEYTNRRLQPTTRIRSTDAARIDYPRSNMIYTLSNGDVGDYPFVSPNYVSSNINMLVTDLGGIPDLLEFNYIHWTFAADAPGTYPMITSQSAWETLQLNPSDYTIYFGTLSLGPLDQSTSAPVIQGITIKEVFFAYYDPKQVQDFIQPIWVFVGKAQIVEGGTLDWVGYVPAVSPEYFLSTAPVDPEAQ